jgi:hypothetical protein
MVLVSDFDRLVGEKALARSVQERKPTRADTGTGQMRRRAGISVGV